MTNVRELAYRVDPALWVRKILGIEPSVVVLPHWRAVSARMEAPRGALNRRPR
jgi:hypothetical protein